MAELLAAGEQVFAALKNLCVWNKTNGGMGTFYRSKHELVFVFKVGSAPHLNTFGLGDTGRYRTNVWDYPGVNSFRAGRMEELALHPTVKPAALVADAIKDCSRRGDIVLDPLGGSGTTLIAAQKSGRRARQIEYDSVESVVGPELPPSATYEWRAASCLRRMDTTLWEMPNACTDCADLSARAGATTNGATCFWHFGIGWPRVQVSLIPPWAKVWHYAFAFPR
jgi:hypothetical protein